MKNLLKKRTDIYKHWDRLYQSMLAGQKVDRELIVEAMSQCNWVDSEIEKHRMKEYMKEKEKSLVDCDKTCGTEAADLHHQELRKQYQNKFGKDIKHG